MRKLRFPHLIAVSAALVLAACSRAPHPDSLQPVHLTLLQTTDFHGALESEARDRASDRPIGGAAFLTALIERERGTNPEGTLVLDSGDIYQGTALSNITEGRAAIDYMNDAGFDAAAIGNHEFDFGIEILAERIAQARFTALCANVRERATGLAPAWAQPYVIITRKGVRVAVIGLITPDTPRVTLPQNVTHLEFLEPIAVANRWIEELIPGQADVAVVICHIGGSQTNDGVVEGELVELAEGIEGECAILGGHTHRQVAGAVGTTAIVQAGSSGRWLGRIDLQYDRAKRAVTGAEAKILTVFADSVGHDALSPDREVDEMVQRFRAEIAPTLDEQIAESATTLGTARTECPMGNWMSDIIRAAAGADIAFQNPGGVRSSIEAGPIRYADVYRVMPFDNTIVVADLSGGEVLEYLETIARRNSFLHTSGLRYTVDYEKDAGGRISAVELTDGSPLDPDRRYAVAVNSFMAQGGDDLPVLTDRPTTRETGLLIREAMMEACRAATSAGRLITAGVEGRVTRISGDDGAGH